MGRSLRWVAVFCMGACLGAAAFAQPESGAQDGAAADAGNDFACLSWGCLGGSVTAGVDAFKDALYSDWPNPGGVVFKADAAAPIPGLQGYGLGVQASASQGYYDFGGRVSAVPSSNAQGRQGQQRQQFYSFGLFRRPDAAGDWWTRWGLGAAWDTMVDHYGGSRADNFEIRQLRWKASYDFNQTHEAGLWGANAGRTDRHAIPPGSGDTPNPSAYRSVDQLNLYYTYHLRDGGLLSAYVGPGVGGSLLPSGQALDWNNEKLVRLRGDHAFAYTLGGDAAAPLNDYLGLEAGFSYAKANARPALSQASAALSAWSVSAGLRFFWGGNARIRADSGRRWMPFLPDPNNGSFLTQSNFED